MILVLLPLIDGAGGWMRCEKYYSTPFFPTNHRCLVFGSQLSVGPFERILLYGQGDGGDVGGM